MKKYFFVSLVLLFSIPYCFSQTQDTINDFSEYIVSNVYMEHTLDSAITVASNCSYFKQLNKRFYIIVDLYTNSFSFRIYPHNVTTICLYKYYGKDVRKRDGICCYKNCYVYLVEHDDNSVLNMFFKSTGSNVDIFLDKSDNIVEQSNPFLYFFKMDFLVENSTIIPKGRNEDEDGDDYDWRKRHLFEYMVQNGDTWQTIASKCGCSLENLKNEYVEYNKPIPGLLLIVRYVFDENDNFQGVIRCL